MNTLSNINLNPQPFASPTPAHLNATPSAFNSNQSPLVANGKIGG